VKAIDQTDHNVPDGLCSLYSS